MMIKTNLEIAAILAIAGLVALLGDQRLCAQKIDAAFDQPADPNGFVGQINPGGGNPEEVKTLEQIREMGGLETPLRPMVTNPNGAEFTRSITPRELAMGRIRSLQQKLALPSEDRSVLESQLKSALAEYFIADMRHRVHELDEIKAKVKETEAKLQKRLASQQEAVDLQLKIMLHEADGLGFFHKNDRKSTSVFGAEQWSVRSQPAGLNGPANVPLGLPSTPEPASFKRSR